MIELFGGWGHFLFFLGERHESQNTVFYSTTRIRGNGKKQNNDFFFFLAGKLVFSCPRICRARFFRRAVEMRSSPNKEELQSKACAVEVMNAQYLAHADQWKKIASGSDMRQSKSFPPKWLLDAVESSDARSSNDNNHKKKRNNHHHKSHLLVLIHTTGGRESVLIWRLSFENVPLSWKQRRHATRVRTDCRREHSRGIFRWLWKLLLFVFFGVLKKWHHDHESRWMVRTPQLDEANSRRCESLALLK